MREQMFISSMFYWSLLTGPRTGTKDYTLKAQANTHKSKDLKNVLKNSSRPRTNITAGMMCDFYI